MQQAVFRNHPGPYEDRGESTHASWLPCWVDVREHLAIVHSPLNVGEQQREQGPFTTEGYRQVVKVRNTA